MNQYYLMAQLPSLDVASEAAPLPITQARFYELCQRFLGKKALHALNGLTLLPPLKGETSGFSVVDEWNKGERSLRIALAKARAVKMKKSFDLPDEYIPSELMQTAKTAAEIENPMEAERFLNGYRLNFLETLRPSDAFCENMVLYYGLKLKLILRMQQFDESKGRDAYRNIYSSILSGDEREAEQ